ncbi:MAG: polysaccharide deacetylase family protein [Niabella sp.]
MKTVCFVGKPSFTPNVFYYIIAALILLTSCKTFKSDSDLGVSVSDDPASTENDGTASAAKKKIYLTFDDGPNKGTKTVLDIVKEEQVPVTFFLVGRHAENSPEQREIMDSLRTLNFAELCNHSYSHANNKFVKFYRHPDLVLADFEKAKKVLKLDCAMARMPGRNIWGIDSVSGPDIKMGKAAADTLQKHGYKLVGWDVEWHFEPKTMLLTKTADELKAQIDSLFAQNKLKCQSHLVLLAHDQAYRNPSNIEELQKFVRNLKQDQGYELELIKNYPGISRN